MCGCRKFVRTCSLFSRGDRNSSQSSGFVDFCSPSCSGRLFFLSVCAPFYRNFMFCFGFKTTAKCFSLSSRTVCFSLLLFVVTLVFFCFTFSALKRVRLTNRLRVYHNKGWEGHSRKSTPKTEPIYNGWNEGKSLHSSANK